MLLFGAVILFGMVSYIVLATVVHVWGPEADPVTTGSPPERMPLPDRKKLPSELEPPLGEALVAKANELFVGTPVYDSDGVTEVGSIKGIELGSKGEIRSFDIQWYEDGSAAHAKQIWPAEINWGLQDHIVAGGEWSHISLEPGHPLKGVLKNQARLDPTAPVPDSKPPEKIRNND